MLFLDSILPGLFSRAIMQSGSPFAHRGLNREPAKQAKHFAAIFNCTQKDNKAMVACLKKVDATTLVNAHKEMNVKFSIIFNVCILISYFHDLYL